MNATRMTRRPHLALLLAATLAVAACGPVRNDDPLRGLVGPSASAPAASAQEARVLNGVARYYRVGMPGAEVVAREFSVGDEGPVLAKATADGEGRFALNFPASVAPGKVVQLVARGQGGQRVMALGRVPAELTPVARKLQQAEGEGAQEELPQGLPAGPLVLDENQTLALMVLAPRIKAALLLGTDLAIENAIASLQAAGEALGSEGVDLVDPAIFDEAVELVFGLVDQFLDTPESEAAVNRVIPDEVVDQLVAQAEALADVIRQEVLDNNLERPDASLTGPLSIGPKDVPPVFEEPGGEQVPGQEPGPAPGPADNTPEPPPDPDVTVDLGASLPAEGEFGTPTGPIEGAAQ